MATIRTAIELQDNFTGILSSIINSVNLGLSAMQDLHQTMNTPVDTTSIQTVMESINQATIAVRQLDAAMRGIETPQTQTPTIPQSSGAGNIPTQQSTDWQSYDAPEIFTGTGIERFQQEIASVNSMLQDLTNSQGRITQMANETEVLSPQAQYDVEMIENRISTLQQSIQQVEQNPLNIGSDSANASLEQLRTRLSQILESQRNLNSAMQGADVSEINAAYLQISQNISNTERMIRDSFRNIPPVQVPITWKSESLEVFTNSGVERFEQEISSANNMLNTLNQTQSKISQRAAQTSLLPANAVADMNNMQNRLQAIQQRIQAIENNPMNIGTDTANTGLERLRGQLNQAVQEQQNLNQAIRNMDVGAANAAYLRLSQTVGSTESYIRDNIDEQGRFNHEIQEGIGQADNLMNSIKKFVGAYATAQTMGSVIQLSDTLTQTTARLDLIVDDGDVEELQNKIFASAQASRGSYLATADAVSKLGMQASQAFNSNDELIAFTELLNKQFVNAGTSAQGIDSVMLQLTQSMASGRLQGEELNAVMDNASIIVQDIQRYLEEVKGIDASNIKELASQGQITADIIKNAMFYAADDIEKKFGNMPMTFGEIWKSFQNIALMVFQPVLQKMSEVANSKVFQGFVNNAVKVISMVSDIALGIFDLLIGIASVVADNWSWISPIIYGIIAALGIYTVALIVNNVIQAISTMQKKIAAIQAVAHGAAITAEMTATTGLTKAQLSFNAALYASPITKVVVIIIAIVAALFALCSWIAKTTDAARTGFGVMTGGINVVIQAVWNAMLVVANVAIGIWDALDACCSNIGTAFHNVVAHIKGWFYSLLSTVLTVVGNICAALNKLPFIEFDYSGVTDKAEEYAAKSKKAHESVKEYESITDAFNEGFHTFDTFQEGWASEAFHAGAAWGDNVAEKFSNLFDKDEEPGPEEDKNFKDYMEDGGIGDSVDNIAGNTESIADGMDITEEDLKYLRDIAEQETINRFTTAEIVIEQTNHNTISGKMDLDGIVSGLTDAANEAVFMIAEGVHI